MALGVSLIFLLAGRQLAANGSLKPNTVLMDPLINIRLV